MQLGAILYRWYLELIFTQVFIPMGCPNNDSNNMPVQRRKTGGRTDRLTDRRQTDRPTFFLD